MEIALYKNVKMREAWRKKKNIRKKNNKREKYNKNENNKIQIKQQQKKSAVQ